MKKIELIILLILFLNGAGYSQNILTLEQSKEFALKNNTKIKNSNLEIEAAHQTKSAAFTKYFPSISAGALALKAKDNIIEIGSNGILNRADAEYLTIVQPVFAGGRIQTGNKLASLGEEVTTYKSKLTKDEVLLKTEEQYWQIISLDEKLKTINAYEELLGNLAQQVDDAYNSGLVMKNDVLKVKLKQSEVLLNKSKLDNGKQLVLMAFCQYIGISSDSMITLQDELSIDTNPQSLSVDHNEALRTRAEYHLLQQSVQAEKLFTRQKLGEYLPQVGIGVSGFRYKIDKHKSANDGMVFGTIQVPISNWWEASHTLQERKIKEQIAGNNLNETTDLLLLQMKKAWQDLCDAYKQVSLSDESRIQAEENLKVNRDSYKNGLVNLSDLLEAQATLQQAKDQLIDAKTNYKIKQSTYLSVTGRK